MANLAMFALEGVGKSVIKGGAGLYAGTIGTLGKKSARIVEKEVAEATSKAAKTAAGELTEEAEKKIAKIAGQTTKEKAATEIGEAAKKRTDWIDGKRADRRSRDAAFKEAVRGESSSAKAAATGSDDVVKKAVDKNRQRFTFDGKVYERTANPNWRPGNKAKSVDASGHQTGHNRFLYTADGAGVSGEVFGSAKKSHLKNGGVLDDFSEEAAKVADDVSKSGPGFLNGIPGWAKGAGLAAAGVVAGNTIFDTDDE